MKDKSVFNDFYVCYINLSQNIIHFQKSTELNLWNCTSVYYF